MVSVHSGISFVDLVFHCHVCFLCSLVSLLWQWPDLLSSVSLDFVLILTRLAWYPRRDIPGDDLKPYALFYHHKVPPAG